MRPSRRVSEELQWARTAEWAPLMMGGRDSTVRLASRITGYTRDAWMMGTNFRSFRSLSA